MKDENGLHFLGWAILAHVVNHPWVMFASALIAGCYAIASIYELYKEVAK